MYLSKNFKKNVGNFKNFTGYSLCLNFVVFHKILIIFFSFFSWELVFIENCKKNIEYYKNKR